jgi:hypothetical protein
MLFEKIMAVYSNNHMKWVVEFYNIKAGVTYSDNCASKG